MTKHVGTPSISNVIPDRTAILTANVQGIAPGYLGVYGGVDLIRDPYTKAASGQLVLTGLVTAEDIHLLAGHDYEKPLASRAAGNLTLTDTNDALLIEARIDGGTTWARDFLAAHASGLIRGLSPGFRVDQAGERIERRGAGILRTITRAALFELSAVTRPAYPSAQIEARAWETHQDRQPYRGAVHHLNRWRV